MVSKMAAGGSKKQKYAKNYKSEVERADEADQSNSELTGLKRKPSRKETRKEKRAQKKARINAHFTSKNEKHKIETGKIETEIGKNRLETEAVRDKQLVTNRKKKRKKKRKPKQQKSQDVSGIREVQTNRILESEEQELEELEKKLQLKRSTLPKAFHEEGLDDIIAVCNAIESGSLKPHSLSITDGNDDDDHDTDDNDDNHDDDDFDDAAKMNGDEMEFDIYQEESDGYIDDSEDDDFVEEGMTKNTTDEDANQESDVPSDIQDSTVSEEDSEHTNEDKQGYDEDAEIEKNSTKARKRRFYSSREELQKSSYDIYGGAVAKYVPPHQRERKMESAKHNKQVNDRLRKQVKGLLNRLSESNISGVSAQIEELYMANSRNDLNEVFSKLLMEACISPSLMPDGLLREHMMLVAILNSRVGSEVGAFFLQKLAVQFDELHSGNSPNNDGKEIHNIVTLFALLYSFKVIDSTLIYDITRRLVGSFLELDVELLLLLIRLIGVEIRRENPESLKEIILQVQAKAATDTQLSNTSRTRFMLDTINALRNNNMRKIPNYDPAPIERARKILKSVVQSTSQNDSAKLSISLSDLLTADQKGRWWIVGSAWSEREKTTSTAPDIPDTTGNAGILELARQQRMNTDIRRNIFCTVMTSEDYVDAFEKLVRMKLKDKQSREIIHVLMDCSLQEKSYNPFYSYLIQKFCEFSRSYQVTVQYSLWDRFKMSSSLTDHNLSNMAQLLVHLLVNKSLSLSVLKVVDFTSLDKPLVNFFTQMLTHILLDYQESTVREVFTRIAPLTKLDTLKESLKLFMKHFLKPKRASSSSKLNRKLKNGDKEEKLDERITLAIDALTSN